MEKEKPKFDRTAFKRAIAQIESNGGKLLDNPNSSAAGRYHFLYRYIKGAPILKGVSKREFINSPELQEKIMDMAIDGTLPGFPSYEKNSYKLKAKYNTNLRSDEIAALTHFLGVGGVQKYLKDPEGFSVPGNTNATVTQYVDRFNKAQGTETSYSNSFTKNEYNDTMPISDPIRGSYVDMNDHISRDTNIKSNVNIDDGSDIDFYEGDIDFAKGNEFAEGGSLDGSDPVGEFTEFEGGGTHEENPLGGIPQGVGANGKLNTVEEGESKYSFDDGDYIFSNRITL